MPPDAPIVPTADETDDHSRRSAALTARLAGTGLGPVEWVEQTGSTNADLMAAAESGAPSGSVLIADHQTAGRGRRDRSWVSVPGASLLMSVLARGPLTGSGIAVAGAALGLAACEACHDLGFRSVRLKWPNDLVVETDIGQAKLAGVLAQSIIRGSEAAVVAGIGVNVRSDELVQRVRDRAAISLADLSAPPDRVLLAAAILERFAAVDPSQDGFWDAYRSSSATLGTVVQVTTDSGVVTGLAVDFDGEGALLLDTPTGRTVVRVGDVESVR